jgi:hypothetical protein
MTEQAPQLWTGNDWVDPSVCRVCFQPECPESQGGRRRHSEGVRVEDGQHQARGYGEWAVHPNEAIFLLHRGYAIVDGVKQPVRFIHNEAFVTQIKVEGTGTEVNHFQTA